MISLLLDSPRYGNSLSHSFIVVENKLLGKQFLPHRNALYLNSVIILTIFLHFLLDILFTIFIVFIILFIFNFLVIFFILLLLLALYRVSFKLVKYVLNLPLELFL